MRRLNFAKIVDSELLYLFLFVECITMARVSGKFCFRCVHDETLMEPLKYSSDLTTATSAAFAFKFADQMIVHFSCRITLCTRAENGCEGISVMFFIIPLKVY